MPAHTKTVFDRRFIKTYSCNAIRSAIVQTRVHETERTTKNVTTNILHS